MTIETGPPHEPFSDYEPKEPTAEELKLAGVSIAGVEGSLTYLKCDVCNWHWGVSNLTRGSRSSRYWICPQDLKEGALLKLR